MIMVKCERCWMEIMIFFDYDYEHEDYERVGYDDEKGWNDENYIIGAWRPSLFARHSFLGLGLAGSSP